MSKKEEAIDVSPKVEKITDEQLKDLQELVGKINNAQLTIGQLETQKDGVIIAIRDFQMKLKSMQDKLEDEYGKVSVNIQDGSISETPEK